MEQINYNFNDINQLQQLNLADLMQEAAKLRDHGHGNIISYSKKVFVPLTQLCRDVCHYCTFAKTPRHFKSAYLSPEEVLAIAKSGEQAGCHEVLFTLGDKPELRYTVAQKELAQYGHQTTLSYLAEMCRMILKETSLLPHVNPGVMTADDIALLRTCSISQGIMLENSSKRLCETGGVHYGSPDKDPLLRLETIRQAGKQKVPFTSGILIGIGETRQERITSLLELKELHNQYNHIQEVIIQNFRAKADTKMANAPEPNFEDLLWTVAIARLIFGPDMNIQAPPNLSPDSYHMLINAGLNDWGGISPVTKDYVNPEAPWPEITRLEERVANAGKILVQRLASYPKYCIQAFDWHDVVNIAPRVVSLIDTSGFVRDDPWSPGMVAVEPCINKNIAAQSNITSEIKQILSRDIQNHHSWTEDEIVKLFSARGKDFDLICQSADQLRKQVSGDVISYVVNRNINYTNVCYFKCKFCAFSKGVANENLRGKPYDIKMEEIVRRSKEAWNRGATEVCLQGGIHPQYTGNTYLNICRAIRAELPDIHIHAFSPLEIWQGAKTLNISVKEFLFMLREAGLNTLPGTAAEILDDEVRQSLCPDKINTNEWLSVMKAAHEVGFKTTATIMFGHIDQTYHWARHLLRIRELQAQTGGFTEFVPLPFVHMEAPIFLRGHARKGPTFREVVLMHAIARLVLYPLINNIQVSWVKLGRTGIMQCLASGANDLGGTLMNESISRAAGTKYGQEMNPTQFDDIILSLGRTPLQRTTLYKNAPLVQQQTSYHALPLQPVIMHPANKHAANT